MCLIIRNIYGNVVTIYGQLKAKQLPLVKAEASWYAWAIVFTMKSVSSLLV
jgi:hypothetical protein